MKNRLDKSDSGFYIIEMETDGWAWWSLYRDCWTKVPYSSSSCEQKWVGKERFIKAGITKFYPNRLLQFEQMGHTIINEIYASDYFPTEIIENIEVEFENKFKEHYHYETIKRWNGYTECYIPEIFPLALDWTKKRLDKLFYL